MRDYDRMPWVIYDFKGDELVNSIPYAYPITLKEQPDGPGIYIAHPGPHDQDEVEDHLHAIWRRGHTGIYVDEGYMIDRNSRFFSMNLTQGRSLQIPMIVLSQRPVWMNRFVFSESDFYQVFALQHVKDRKKMEEYVPADLSQRLPHYHSYYYDVAEDKLTTLSPVPDMPEILRSFERRLARRAQAI